MPPAGQCSATELAPSPLWTVCAGPKPAAHQRRQPAHATAGQTASEAADGAKLRRAEQSPLASHSALAGTQRHRPPHRHPEHPFPPMPPARQCSATGPQGLLQLIFGRFAATRIPRQTSGASQPTQLRERLLPKPLAEPSFAVLSKAFSQAIQLLLGHSDIIVLTELPKPDKDDPKPNPGTE